MKDVLLIYDPDLYYGQNLAEKLSLREDLPQEVHWFSNPWEMMTAAKKAEKPLVLTVREPGLKEQEELLNRARKGECVLMFLMEVPGYDRVEDVPAIYKYRPVSLILQSIREIAEGRQKDADVADYCRAQIIGVMSPVGRALKTSFCLTLAQLLAQGGRVLYANLEMFSGFRYFVETAEASDLGEYLYEFETTEDCGFYLEKPLTFHGVDILPPAKRPEDVYQTEPQTLKKMLLQLIWKQSYDVVVLDLGTDIRLAETLLPLCNQVYVPSRRDELSQAKVKEFMEWLAEEICEDSFRIEEVILPYRQNFTAGRESTEQLLWSELGDYTRELLGGIF